MQMYQRIGASSLWPLFACVLIVEGVYLVLIGQLGNPTPFWDQWDAEGMPVYLPYINQSLRIGDLFTLHNEHRIPLTKLLGLLHLIANEYCDTILQMIINSLIHIAAIGVFLYLIARPLNRAATWVFLQLTFCHYLLHGQTRSRVFNRSFIFLCCSA
jgi:hypothetical protein